MGGFRLVYPLPLRSLPGPLLSGELYEVVAIASDQHATVVASELEDRGIGSIRPKNLAESRHLMAELLEQVVQVIRHVVVQHELQRPPSAICRATSRSISPL